MTNNIRENLEILAALQYADSSRDALEQKLSGVDDRMDALSKELRTFEEQMDSGKQELEELQKQYRSDEGQVKTIEAAIVKSDQKLSSVKTNKEYQSMLKEIDELKLKKSDIEDRMLEALDSIEAAEKRVAILRADLDDMRREIDEKKAEIEKQADGQRQELGKLSEKREAIWARLEPKMQTFYSRASKQGHGIAVAPVVEAVCQVCRVGIPPQAFINLMKLEEMQMCPSCQRIIYPEALIDVDMD